MGQLHDRNCRRAFAPAEAFQADSLPAERFQAEMGVATAAGRALAEGAEPGKGGAGPGYAPTGRAWGLLMHAPYLVPFRQRARLFQSVVAAERARARDMEVMHSLAAELGGAPNRFFAVRRTQVRLALGMLRASSAGKGPVEPKGGGCTWLSTAPACLTPGAAPPPTSECPAPIISPAQTLQDAYEQLNNLALHGRVRIQVCARNGGRDDSGTAIKSAF